MPFPVWDTREVCPEISVGTCECPTLSSFTTQISDMGCVAGVGGVTACHKRLDTRVARDSGWKGDKA